MVEYVKNTYKSMTQEEADNYETLLNEQYETLLNEQSEKQKENTNKVDEETRKKVKFTATYSNFYF